MVASEGGDVFDKHPPASIRSRSGTRIATTRRHKPLRWIKAETAVWAICLKVGPGRTHVATISHLACRGCSSCGCRAVVALRPRLEVIAVAAERGTAVEIVYATGAVEPVRWAKVTSLIRDRIVDICHCEGKAVAKDDVLARLDDREHAGGASELRAREDFASANCRGSPSWCTRRRHHPGATNARRWTSTRSRR